MIEKKFSKHLEEARMYKCEKCHEYCDPFSSDWRFNGNNWEHYHEYPLGHVRASLKNES